MYAPIYTHLRAHSLLARVIKPSNNSPPTTQKDVPANSSVNTCHEECVYVYKLGTD